MTGYFRSMHLQWLMVVAVSGSLFTVSPSYAAFEDTGTGARPAALGGAYAAEAQDMQSLMYNPAGLAGARQAEVMTEYSKLFTALSDNSNLSTFFLGYGQPIKNAGTVAVGWKQFNLSGLYSERTLSIGYGQWLNERWALGVALKQLHTKFTDEAVIVDQNGSIQYGTPDLFRNGTGKSVYSFDMGTILQLTRKQRVGLSVQDVNEPDIALSDNDRDVVRKTIRLGWALQANPDFSVKAGVMIHHSLPNEGDYNWIGGMEKWWRLRSAGAFAVRGAMALGSREYQQFSMGAGYRYQRVTVDYAFVFNMAGTTLGTNAGTHRFSVAYRFGPYERPDFPILKEDPTVSARKAEADAHNQAVMDRILREAQTTENTAPTTIETRKDLYVSLSKLFQDQVAYHKAHVPMEQRLKKLENVFGLLSDGVHATDKDLVDSMTLNEQLEDGIRQYRSEKESADKSPAELYEFLLVRAEKILEPLMIDRVWDRQNEKHKTYSAWLNDAWSFERVLVDRHAPVEERVNFLYHLLIKAGEYEESLQPSVPQHASTGPNPVSVDTLIPVAL